MAARPFRKVVGKIGEPARQVPALREEGSQGVMHDDCERGSRPPSARYAHRAGAISSGIVTVARFMGSNLSPVGEEAIPRALPRVSGEE